MGNLWSNHGNQLDSGGTRANDTYPFAFQIQALFGPPAGVGPNALKVVDTLKIGHIASGKKAHGGD